MPTEKKTTVRVVVKLRDLDTDARTIFEHDLDPPRTTAQQRSQLIAVVSEHKPEAEIRSFANHAASFIDGEHLVVAYYESPREIGRANKAAGEDSLQEELFAQDAEKAA